MTKYYDDVDFDSDSEEEDRAAGETKKKKKKRYRIPTKDELLCDLENDDRDQAGLMHREGVAVDLAYRDHAATAAGSQ